MRTTLSLDDDVAAAVQRLREERNLGLSDAVNGASAVLLYAQAMGHTTAQMGGSFATPAKTSAA